MPLRSLFLTTIFIACSFSAFESVLVASNQAESRKPNIIFVLTDDQRFDALGCMGNPIVQTPHIDRLAAQGTLFTNMFCTTSICATSRATFLTGQYERRHKINGFRTPLSEQQFAQSFPGLLRAGGYRTAMIGKWGLGGELPADKYDTFKGYKGQGRYFPKGKQGEPGEHRTAQLAQQAVDFLDEATGKKPFLLQMYTKAAHCQDGELWPFPADPRYNHLFADVTIPLPKTAIEQHFNALPEFLRTSEARKRWHIRFEGNELYQKSVKDYYRLIAGIDDLMGRIVATLKQQNLFDNTVIILTSDNGFYLGEHGLAGKWYMHEESIRLPLVVYDPRLSKQQKGKKVPQLVLNTDIAPTICQLAGVDVPPAMQGKSLVPLLQGEPVDWREDFLYEHRFVHARIPQTEGVRTTRWKYTRYISIDPVYEELFDLETDPHEEHNLAGNPKHAQKLAELKKRTNQLSKQLE